MPLCSNSGQASFALKGCDMHSLFRPSLLSYVGTLTGIGFALSIAPAYAQGLNDQSVNVTFRSPGLSTIVTDVGTQNVAKSGTTFLQNNGTSPFMQIGVTTTQIVVKPTPNNYADIFGNSDFIGYVVSEVGPSPVAITGVTIDPSTSVSSFMAGNETFGANRVTFDANDVFINLEGLQLSSTSNVTLDLITAAAPAAVPEASTTVSFGLLLALGVGGAVVAARRKKAAV